MFSPFTLNMMIVAAIGLITLGLIYLRLTNQTAFFNLKQSEEKKYAIDQMMEYVKQALNEIVDSNLLDLGLSEEEYARRKSQRIRLKKALKGCTTGDINDKIYVKEFILDLLYKTYAISETNINYAIPFDYEKDLSAQDKFEILMYQYKKTYGYRALIHFMETYQLDELKQVIEDQVSSYIVTAEEIHDIYAKEQITLTLEDKINIIVQRIYQQYKGFSVIDEIRDMKIDGVSGGVSGIPDEYLDVMDDEWTSRQSVFQTPQSYDSVWIFFRGKPIHLSFLSFGSERELRRVCQNIYKYNQPGQLSEANGYKVNQMADGSRVVVLRPTFSESWAFFVRKFDIPKANLEHLVDGNQKEFAIELMQYLVKGARIIAVTGSQGTGKTTLLMAMVKSIYASYTLRVQEMAFELHLRKIYPMRNILSLRETDTISGQEGLDVQKKTDGTVNIVGEVATDPVAAWMIQAAQVASLFTLFTHHAKTFRDLVFSLRNSLLKTGVFHNEGIAEQQVVNVLNFNIHLKKDYDGKRFIERITECVPIEQEDDPTDFLKEKDFRSQVTRFMETTAEFYKRITHPKTFEYRNILEYRNGVFTPVHPISKRNQTEMMEQMSPEDAESFERFIAAHWRE